MDLFEAIPDAGPVIGTIITAIAVVAVAWIQSNRVFGKKMDTQTSIIKKDFAKRSFVGQLRSAGEKLESISEKANQSYVREFSSAFTDGNGDGKDRVRQARDRLDKINSLISAKAAVVQAAIGDVWNVDIFPEDKENTESVLQAKVLATVRDVEAFIIKLIEDYDIR